MIAPSPRSAAKLLAHVWSWNKSKVRDRPGGLRVWCYKRSLRRGGKYAALARRMCLMPETKFWAELTWTDFETRDMASTIAVLPIAATEQHGPHLPLGTDTFI